MFTFIYFKRVLIHSTKERYSIAEMLLKQKRLKSLVNAVVAVYSLRLLIQRFMKHYSKIDIFKSLMQDYTQEISRRNRRFKSAIRVAERFCHSLAHVAQWQR